MTSSRGSLFCVDYLNGVDIWTFIDYLIMDRCLLVLLTLQVVLLVSSFSSVQAAAVKARRPAPKPMKLVLPGYNLWYHDYCVRVPGACNNIVMPNPKDRDLPAKETAAVKARRPALKPMISANRRYNLWYHDYCVIVPSACYLLGRMNTKDRDLPAKETAAVKARRPALKPMKPVKVRCSKAPGSCGTLLMSPLASR